MAVRIDVLMPVYARSDRSLLQRAINSVLAQELPAQTLWLLINGGLNYEREQLGSFVQTLLPVGHSTALQVEILEQTGITAALNRGLELAQADWLARLDADDQMTPPRLRLMVEHLQQCQSAGGAIPSIIGSAVAVLDSRGERATGHVLRRPTADRAIRRYLCIGNPFFHPSVMIRRSVLVAAGGYRLSPGTEDLDLWLRLERVKGIYFANLSEALTLYTKRSGSLSHQKDSFLQTAQCRWRNCTDPLRLLVHAPKIIVDLVRYLMVLMSSH